MFSILLVTRIVYADFCKVTMFKVHFKENVSNDTELSRIKLRKELVVPVSLCHFM